MNYIRRKQNRVIIGFILFFLLACNTALTVLHPTPTIPAPTEAATGTTTPPISQQVTLVSVPFTEENKSPSFSPYKITAQTPQLTGSDDPGVVAFNQRLNGLVTKEVDMWRQSFQQAPLTPQSNGSTLDVTYTLVSQIG